MYNVFLEEKMANKKHEAEGFEEFLAEYNAAEVPEGKHINSSKFTLEEQLERFSNFSHSKEESEIMSKEVCAL